MNRLGKPSRDAVRVSAVGAGKAHLRRRGGLGGCTGRRARSGRAAMKTAAILIAIFTQWECNHRRPAVEFFKSTHIPSTLEAIGVCSEN